MRDTFSFAYEEACRAQEAKDIVMDRWVEADTLSEEEAILWRISCYLEDRFVIAIAFASLASENGRTQ